MKESSYHPPDRVRSWGCQILYEAFVEGGVQMRTLPFVVGVLGDFGAHGNRGPLHERAFLPIDRDNFDAVMKRCDARLQLRVPDVRSAAGSERTVELRFESLEDFEPSGVVRQMDSLQTDAANADPPLAQLVAMVLRHPDFLKLEGTWRGLHYLVTHSETSQQQQIKILDLSKLELRFALQCLPELEQSELCQKIAVEPYRRDGAEPFGVLIGDYEFTHHPDDVGLLTQMAELGAAVCCPFVAAASPELFGLSSWRALNEPRDLTKCVESSAHAAWNRFRDSDDARYVVLTVPRTLARLPYGPETGAAAGIEVDEMSLDASESPSDLHSRLCWMSTAYVLGARLTDAFAKRGLCLGLRTVVDPEVWDFGTWEGEGRIEGLPRYVVRTDVGDPQPIGPTEVALTSRREWELSRCGLLALCHNRQAAAFLSTPSCQRPKGYCSPDASVNAHLAAKLSCILVMSRFAHYVKAIYETESKIPDRDYVQGFLNRWIANYVANYVAACGPPSDAVRRRYPLADARIELCDDPSRPGGKLAVMWLRPWLGLDYVDLTASLRTVIRLN